MATPRPAQRSISMSLRPSPIASTSSCGDAELVGDQRRRRTPWRRRPGRGRATRSSRRRSRCRGGPSRAPSSTKSSAVASGSRMITRLTWSATRSATSVGIMSPDSSPDGERPVDAVADAPLLDRDQRVGALAQHGLDRRTGVEDLLVDHLESAGSGTPPPRWTPPPTAARRPRRGRPSRSAIRVMPWGERPLASTTWAPASYARRTASRVASGICSYVVPTPSTHLSRVPSMSRATRPGRQVAHSATGFSTSSPPR